MKEPEVLIIIVNYNTEDDTIELIESIRRLEYKNYEILIVDNASKSIEKLKKIKNVKLMKNKVNSGITGAVNLAIRENKNYDYYLLLNSDAVVDRFLLKELVNVAIKDERIGFVGSAIFNYYSKDLDSLGGKLDFITGIAKPIKDYYAPAELKKNEYLDACALLISNKIIKEVGMYDENFFMYCETEDLIFKAYERGFKAYINPNAKVYHKVYGSSGGKKNKFVVYYLYRNRIILLKKHLKLFRFLLFLLIHFIVIIQVQAILFIFRRQFNLIKSVYKGSRDGVKEAFRKY
ncbi:MAG TPA: glycosyltransferase family 2 protein [Candidatus Nanoarchaeia archaeon]|nr:glycosyltransferase family 2 protein [Candidatus Nanoarchaeia archaeon]